MELPEELRIEGEELKVIDERLRSKLRINDKKYDNLLDKIAQLAKFQPGMKVESKKYRIGIIRKIIVTENSEYTWREANVSDGCNVTIKYKVGKITKKGKIHANHNIDYTPIDESELTEVTE